MGDVPAWVRRYVGIPFAEKGRDRKGCDCWGLYRLVLFERRGLALPSYDGRYATTADREEIERLIRGEMAPWRAVEAGREEAFDAVLLRIVGNATHVAAVVGRGMMLHTERGIGAMLESYDRPLWRPRILGFWRHEALS